MPPNEIDSLNSQGDQAINRAIAAWLELANLDIKTFPAGPDKKPLVKDWQGKATTDKATIERWIKRWPDANPAIPCGDINNLAVLDLDLRPDGRDGIQAAKDLGLDLSKAFQVKTPSGGIHAYFLHREGLSNSAAHLPDGIDIRGQGGYVLAPGSVLSNGKSYRIIGEGGLSDIEMLPPFPKRLMPPPREEAQPSASEHDDISPADLDSILAELSKRKEWRDDRNGWLKVGMALHDYFGGSQEGLDLWTGFSEQSAHFNERELKKDWRSFQDKPRGITIGTLIDAAPEWSEARRWAQILEDFTTLDWTEDDDGEETGWGGNVTDLTPDQCMIGATASMPYLVKHLIYEAAQVVIWGLPNAGKSVLAPYLGIKVAQGKSVFGRRVTQAPVLYGSFEGAPVAMQRRIAALHEKCGPAPDFHLVQRLGSLLLVNGKPSKAERTLHKMIKTYGAKLLFIDTLAAAFAGINEDKMSSDGMGVVLAFMRRISDLGCAVVIVHHPKKDGSDMRGSSGLLGAVDLTIRVEAKKTDGSMYAPKQSVARSEKVRDTAGNDVMAFSITQHVFGQDTDGDDVTTVYCEEIDDFKDDDEAPDLSGSEKSIFAVLQEMTAENDSIGLAQWRERCISGQDHFASDERDSRRRSFSRAMDGLTDKKLIRLNGKLVSIFGGDHDA